MCQVLLSPLLIGRAAPVAGGVLSCAGALAHPLDQLCPHRQRGIAWRRGESCGGWGPSTCAARPGSCPRRPRRRSSSSGSFRRSGRPRARPSCCTSTRSSRSPTISSGDSSIRRERADYQPIIRGCREAVAQLDRHRAAPHTGGDAIKAKAEGIKRELERVRSIDYFDSSAGDARPGDLGSAREAARRRGSAAPTGRPAAPGRRASRAAPG